MSTPRPPRGGKRPDSAHSGSARSGSARSGNPAKRASSGSSADPGRNRSAFAQHSASILARLTQLPRYTVPGIVLALMLVGLTAPLGYALPALALVAALVAWLAYLSWPALDPRGRMVRTIMIALIVGAVVARALA